MDKRHEIVEKNRSTHFSAGIKLDKAEANTERKLLSLRDQIFEEDPSIITGSFYEKSAYLKKTKLYEALNIMPKPAIHHIHLTASAPINFLIKLTYYDHVYFNQRENKFKVTKNPVTDAGYIKVNDLRKHWAKAEDFDNYLRDEILLNQKEMDSQETQEIWAKF